MIVLAASGFLGLFSFTVFAAPADLGAGFLETDFDGVAAFLPLADLEELDLGAAVFFTGLAFLAGLEAFFFIAIRLGFFSNNYFYGIIIDFEVDTFIQGSHEI